MTNERSGVENAENADTVLADSVSEASGARFEAPPPRIAGRYEVLGLLGSGGMGAVYRVRDGELGEIVALKMLRPEWGQRGDALERFRREVRLARRVTHENVARTFDIGEHEGERFLTMECVDGGSLAQRIAERGALPLREIDSIARGIGAGLVAAHRAGVVHRDLKPENVLLARDGRVVVTDFGISHAVDTGERGVVGTPAYMAPEQLEPEAVVDHRADVYGLGAVLYEMATGERAWRGEVVTLFTARARGGPPPDPRELRPGLPASFAEVVMRCMAVAPSDRFASVEDVLRALPGPADEGPAPLGVMPAPVRATKTVAVLPFTNEGPAEDLYLADGVTADLIDTLSMTRGLLVRPRSVVAAYRGTSQSAGEVGRALSVHVVVEGSLRRIGQSVRLGVRAIGTDDGFQLWARRVDAPLEELLVASDEMARAIAGAMATELVGPAAVAPADPAAVELYLRATEEFRRSWSQSSVVAAELFERALRFAPADPKFLAGTAAALVRMLFFGEGDRAAVIARARELAERAVAMAPERGDAWATLAALWLNAGDAVRAARALRQGLCHAPHSAELQDRVGRLLAEITPIEEAVARLEIAISLEPTLISARVELGRVRALQGRWELADAAIEGLEPSTALDAHRARLAFWRRTPGRIAPAPPGTYARLYSELREPSDLTAAHRAFMRERAETASGRIRSLFFQRNTEIHAFAGELDAAFVALRGALDAELIDLAWLTRCPLLDVMRPDPRFSPLCDELAARVRSIGDALRRDP